MSRFRVGTYNVHKCVGVDWRVSSDRIADVISQLQADVLAVQEILQPQAEAVSVRTGLSLTFGPARHHRGEPYGNAVFTHHRIISSQNHDLSVQGREPRRCLHVVLRLPDHLSIQLFAVHLGTSFLERREQARRFVSPEILERPELRGRRIVAGDFNEWTRGLATRMLSRHLQSADIAMHLKRRRTYPGLLPFMHLDHIYYDPAFHLREMHLYRSRLALLASDHLPLVADFDTRT